MGSCVNMYVHARRKTRMVYFFFLTFHLYTGRTYARRTEHHSAQAAAWSTAVYTSVRISHPECRPPLGRFFFVCRRHSTRPRETGKLKLRIHLGVSSNSGKERERRDLQRRTPRTKQHQQTNKHVKQKLQGVRLVTTARLWEPEEPAPAMRPIDSL